MKICSGGILCLLRSSNRIRYLILVHFVFAFLVGGCEKNNEIDSGINWKSKHDEALYGKWCNSEGGGAGSSTDPTPYTVFHSITYTFYPTGLMTCKNYFGASWVTPNEDGSFTHCSDSHEEEWRGIWETNNGFVYFTITSEDNPNYGKTYVQAYYIYKWDFGTNLIFKTDPISNSFSDGPYELQTTNL